MYEYLFLPFALLDILATIFVCLFVNWWAPLFVQADGHLPNWLAWADTFDNPLSFGAFQKGVPDSYWQHVSWLYRNPAYGFSYFALGIPFVPEEWKVIEFSGSEENKDLYFYAESNKGKFNKMFYVNGILIKSGWKSWNCFDQSTKTFKQNWARLPFIFSISKPT